LEQELLTLPERLCSPLVSSRVYVLFLLYCLSFYYLELFNIDELH
jgi:hypothetical protein